MTIFNLLGIGIICRTSGQSALHVVSKGVDVEVSIIVTRRCLELSRGV